MLRHILVNHFLEYSAERFPEKAALIYQNARLTYSQLDTMANRLANTLLDIGVQRGDRIAVFMDNSIEAVISIFGILKTGAVFSVINHTTKTEKLNYIMHDSRANTILAQGNRAEVVRKIKSPYLKSIIMCGADYNTIPGISFEEIVSTGSDKALKSTCIDLDLASIIYTSGSTGQPKGVMLSHLNMVSAAHSITTYLANNETDVIINMLPLSFDYGLYQILMGFKIGGTVVLEKSFAYPYQIVDALIKEKVTGFPGVPTIFAILLKMKDLDKYDFGSLRYITNTAAALPVSHIKKLRELFPKAKLYSMYGLTECKRVSYLPPADLDRKPTSVGRGMPNEEVYIVDDKGDRVRPGVIGELVVRGSNVMLGYWGMSEESAKCLKDGAYPGEKVLYTGDLFKMDEEGYLYFIARKDDIIKCKGEKISPKEIENVLYSLEGILEAAVVGVPDEILGQAVKAYVAIEKGANLTDKDILRYCSQHLENYMIPKYLEIRESLPKTATGKIRKQDLKVAHQFITSSSQ